MAALVQTYPAQQSSAPVSLMQPRSQSSSGAHHHNNSSNSAAAHHPHNNSSTRSYRDAVAGNSAYRGGYNSAPVATYAFSATPGLSHSKPTNTQQSKADKSPVIGRPEDSRHGYTSLEAISSDQSLRPPLSQSSSSRSVDDLATTRQATRPNLRPLSTASLQPPGAGLASPARPSPDRYRKVARRTDSSQSAQPSGSGMAAVAAVYTNSGQSNSNPSLPHGQQNGVYQAPFIGDYAGQLRSQSVDDIHTHTSIPGAQQSYQNRRRSVGPASLATTENFQNFLRQEMAANQSKAAAARPASPAQPKHGGELKAPHRPGSRRTGSTDSSASGTSSRNSSIVSCVNIPSSLVTSS